MPYRIAPQACYLVALARNVEEGEVVEVDHETADSLTEQGWKASRKGPRRTEDDAAAGDDQAAPSRATTTDEPPQE